MNVASLPQLSGGLFVTDGGLETTLIFHQGIDLPAFASFDLLRSDEGKEALRAYFAPYIALAREQGVGLVIDTATWRANPDWAAVLGYSSDELDAANRRANDLADELRAAAAGVTPIVIEGVIGPRGDGYVVETVMTPEAAERYHAPQIAVHAEAVDLITAVTMTYAEEAIGIVRAATAIGIPVSIFFTVETDGRLPSGQPLRAAIERVDAETGGAAAYFGINCAHPTHFADVLEDTGPWLDRIRGLRANASTMSHAELDAAEELDDGDPAALAAAYVELRRLLPNLNVVGGCCGTDHRHVDAICSALRDA